MKKKLSVLVLVFVTIAILVSCSTAPSQTKTPDTNLHATQTGSEQKPAVSIENFSFNPSTLTISKGTTVVWTNNDSANHEIKSDNFRSPTLPSGKTFEFKFDTAGTYNYICGVHPSMKGQIIVK